jgi:hypothetical protein
MISTSTCTSGSPAQRRAMMRPCCATQHSHPVRWKGGNSSDLLGNRHSACWKIMREACAFMAQRERFCVVMMRLEDEQPLQASRATCPAFWNILEGNASRPFQSAMAPCFTARKQNTLPVSQSCERGARTPDLLESLGACSYCSSVNQARARGTSATGLVDLPASAPQEQREMRACVTGVQGITGLSW